MALQAVWRVFGASHFSGANAVSYVLSLMFAHVGAQALRGRSFTAEIAESAENGSGEFGSKPNSESLRALRDLCGEFALRRDGAVVTRGLNV